MDRVYMIGNAHLDPVWFWHWQEGLQEVKATFRSALDRMNESPDFIFTCACAAYYQWVEKNDEEMFEEIRARVREGRWVIVGGMWIQPDMNVPGGESMARHFLYSQRYFKEKFGVMAVVGYNVDSFGHQGSMPRLYRHGGIGAYVWMRPSAAENPRIPIGPMMWEGVDGTAIPAYHIFDEYTCFHDVARKIEENCTRAQALKLPTMCLYGVGNHGGGPTVENLREIDACRRENPAITYASPNDYFQRLRESNPSLPLWRGELQHHASGCYSTHSKSKRLHRRAENDLLRMEKFAVLSQIRTGHRQEEAFVRRAWENLLFNEFHDIMGGCSAESALDAAIIQLEESVSIAAREENAALQRISWQVDTSKGLESALRSKEEDWSFWGIRGRGTPVVVFNPHEFEAVGTVQVGRPVRSVRDESGNPVACQRVRAERTNGADSFDSIFRAKVPGLGHRLYWMFLEEGENGSGPSVSARQNILENEHIRVEIDGVTGCAASLMDKHTGVDVMADPARCAVMNIELVDTWAHNVFTFDREMHSFEAIRMEILECGPVRAAIRVDSVCASGEMTQIYTLYGDSRQVDVQVRLRMKEGHRMGKLCLPTRYADGRDVAEIAFAAIERSASGEEEPCQRWIAMQGSTGGLAVLNDGKYSYSAQNGELRLTFANTSIYADHYGQNHRDAACRYMDLDEQTFHYALLPYAGSWRDQALHRRASLMHQNLVWVVETYHKGRLEGVSEGVRVDNPHIAMGTLKPAEDGCGYILRLWETSGARQRVHVDLRLLGWQGDMCFEGFEIKTLRITPEGEVQELDFREM